MQKRGISPLIATVLLIAFTIVLATLIMVFGKGLTKQAIEKDSSVQRVMCATDINFNIDSAYFNLNTVSLTMTNSGGNIGGFAFRVIGDKGTDVAVINEGVEGGKTKEISFLYDDGFAGEAQKIEVFPRVSIGNGQAYETCEQQSKIYNFQ